MTTAEIEKRLSAIEAQLAALNVLKPPATKAHPVHVLDSIHDTFENDAAFREATRLGKQWRATQNRQVRKPSKAKRS